MKKIKDDAFQNLHHFFEHQAQTHPEQIALVCETATLTYQELNERANQLAHYLKSKGVHSGDLIGLYLEQSINVYIAILAVLKVGAAYVPLDPNLPIERLRYIVTNCNLSVIIVSKGLVNLLKDISNNIININAVQKELIPLPKDNLNETINPDDLCYVIYTSGTTGKPKGVAITHRSVSNYVQAGKKIYQIKKSDKVYQGFSIAFDASIEEIWNAFAAGATLITSTLDNVRSGAGLVDFLNQYKITIFSCVPTLLSMLEGEIPSLRLLILGGEVLPKYLITHWHRPGLRILNTYGPTEGSVVVTYAECAADKPVTIGKAIPNCQVFILNNGLKPVAQGDMGELCISGVCLAKGYINQPELSQQKFVQGPDGARLYRTGDLARFNAEGDIEFLGRVDHQVKLRGFRIELAEIENVLEEYPGIKQAVVTVQELVVGVQSLVAYLVAEHNKPVDIGKLTQWLRERLPHYMVPSLFEILPSLPMLSSGKVDRAHLPKPHFKESATDTYIAPHTATEKKIAKVWEKFLKQDHISVTADFFRDLGGHSLFAARIVSELRKYPEMQYISLLDIYENPTIEQLAKKQAQVTPKEKSTTEKKAPVISNLQYRLCGIAQAVGSYFLFAIKAWELLLIILVLTAVANQFSIYSWQFLATIFLLLLTLPIILFTVAILSKWLLLWRIKPGKYRLWSWYYIRWWLVQRIQKTVLPLNYLIGSPLINIYLRLLGANIGRHCYLGTFNFEAYDLLTIGDNSSIGYNAMLLGSIVEDGWLKIGSITLGKNCYIGAKSTLDINTKLDDQAALGDLSLLPANTTVPSEEYYEGSPAAFKKQADINQQITAEKNTSLQDFGFGILHCLGLVYISIIYYASFIPAIILIEFFFNRDDFLQAVLVAAPLGALIFFALFFLGVVLTKKIFLGKMRTGTYKLHSLYYLRYWIVSRLISVADLGVMADSLFLPFLFRLLGGKIGKYVEIGAVQHVMPDLVTMKEESFIAGAGFVGLPWVAEGYVHFEKTEIGKRTFIGNVALIPSGTKLGEQDLIGSLSVPPAPESAAKNNTAWFGSPAIVLPRRETFAGFSEEETYYPNASLYIKRLIIEFIRTMLPSIFFIVGLVGIFFAIDFLYQRYSLLLTIILFPLVEFLIILAMTALAIIIKWLLMGKIHPTIKPLWSVYIWKYDIIVYLYERFINPTLLEPLFGTPFAPFILRLLGTKIGKRVFINTVNFTEFDLIEIGNDVALNLDCFIQTHLYEDRIFKTSNIKITDGCTVGANAVVLYDTVMEKNSSLGSLSLLMKGETLPAGTYWEGIPAQRAIKSNVTANH